MRTGGHLGCVVVEVGLSWLQVGYVDQVEPDTGPWEVGVDSQEAGTERPWADTGHVEVDTGLDEADTDHVEPDTGDEEGWIKKVAGKIGQIEEKNQQKN